MDNSFNIFDQYHDYLLVTSIVVILVSFLFWRNSFLLPSFFRNIIQFIKGDQSSSPQQQQQQQQSSSEQVQQTEPFNETFSDNDDDVFNVNIIQSESTYNRKFKKSIIRTVFDLKKYFYPEDVQSQKRIIFIHNGRSMIDAHQLSSYPAFNNNSNSINSEESFTPTIHCIIKTPLSSDQISNDPNIESDTSDLTWVTTKSLYTLTGLFLILLWTLQFTKPKFFDVFSTILLFLFTFCWGISFYSSLKSSPMIQSGRLNPSPFRHHQQ